MVSEELRSNYEELRGEVVSGSAGTARGHGWAPLISRGMAAWMRACLEMRTARTRRESRENNGNDVLFSSTRNDLAAALAGMALGIMKETTA